MVHRGGSEADDDLFDVFLDVTRQVAVVKADLAWIKDHVSSQQHDIEALKEFRWKMYAMAGAISFLSSVAMFCVVNFILRG